LTNIIGIEISESFLWKVTCVCPVKGINRILSGLMIPSRFGKRGGSIFVMVNYMLFDSLSKRFEYRILFWWKVEKKEKT